MAGSEVEICNAALSRIGQSLRLSTTEADIADVVATNHTPAAQASALWYPRARDATLRRYRWPFAQARVLLAEAAGETREDWGFVYRYPADCVRLHMVVTPGTRNPTPDVAAPTKIEAEVDGGGETVGKLILCDEADAEVIYTRRVTNVGVYEADFEDALIWRLAADLARELVKGQEGRALSVECTRYFEAQARVAYAAAQGEQTGEPEPRSSFERARG